MLKGNTYLPCLERLVNRHLRCDQLLVFGTQWAPVFFDKGAFFNTHEIAEIVQAGGWAPELKDQQPQFMLSPVEGTHSSWHRLIGRASLTSNNELTLRGSDLRILLTVTSGLDATRSAHLLPYRHARKSEMIGSVEGPVLTGLCAYTHIQRLLLGVPPDTGRRSKLLRLIIDVPDDSDGLLHDKFAQLSQTDNAAETIDGVGVVMGMFNTEDESKHLALFTLRPNPDELPQLLAQQQRALSDILKSPDHAQQAVTAMYGGSPERVTRAWGEAMKKKSAREAGLAAVHSLQAS